MPDPRDRPSFHESEFLIAFDIDEDGEIHVADVVRLDTEPPVPDDLS